MQKILRCDYAYAKLTPFSYVSALHFSKISSSQSNALKLLAFEAGEGNDLSSLPEKPFFCMTANTGITGLPDGWPQARHDFIRFYNGNLAYTLDLLANYGNQRLAYRLATGDWSEIATATKPQEFDLPLAEGYTANGGCKYSKDQFGIVRVVGNINKSSGAFAPNTPFATLPAGFRPGRYGGFVAIANSLPVEVSKRHPAVVQVSVDGNISISMMSETDQSAFQQIIFAIQFLAAD